MTCIAWLQYRFKHMYGRALGPGGKNNLAFFSSYYFEIWTIISKFGLIVS